ncbi:hypothetical protein SRABI26_04255 [Arthrobacter sp. Bi26]|nr:hypothetical protein SRABI26_04255 [Arthrobacter sp. Bi26]
MAEGLRRVAKLTAGLDAPLLAEESDVVAQRQQALEQFPGLVAPARPDQRLHQPEGAR